MTKEIKVSTPSGIGFFGLLTIVLIALKLCNQITISWWWIAACFFAPWIILLTILGVTLLVALGVALLAAVVDKKERIQRVPNIPRPPPPPTRPDPNKN